LDALIEYHVCGRNYWGLFARHSAACSRAAKGTPGRWPWSYPVILPVESQFRSKALLGRFRTPPRNTPELDRPWPCVGVGLFGFTRGWPPAQPAPSRCQTAGPWLGPGANEAFLRLGILAVLDAISARPSSLSLAKTCPRTIQLSPAGTAAGQTPERPFLTGRSRVELDRGLLHPSPVFRLKTQALVPYPIQYLPRLPAICREYVPPFRRSSVCRHRGGLCGFCKAVHRTCSNEAIASELRIASSIAQGRSAINPTL